jgi:hypothetical protein
MNDQYRLLDNSFRGSRNMPAIGCLIPFIVLLVGAGIGGAIGGTVFAVYGGIAGFVIGLIGALVSLRAFGRARDSLPE